MRQPHRRFFSATDLSYLTLFNESYARVVLNPSRLEQLVSCFYVQFLSRSQRA